MERVWKLSLVLFFLALTQIPFDCLAGTTEVSVGLGFNRSQYGAVGNSWSRRWTASIGYNFTEITGIELSYQNSTDVTSLPGYQETQLIDQMYSIDWTQALMPRGWPFQPYFKVGIGQLNRDATGYYPNGTTPLARTDSLSGVLGFGVKFYLTKNIAVRGELTSYMPAANINTIYDNISFNGGLSFMF
jgi:hypothetical protein